MTSPPRSVYALGDRRLDFLALALVMVFLLATCFTLRVYYRITVYEVDVVHVAAGGSRVSLEMPKSVESLQLWHLPPESVLGHLEGHFGDLLREERWRRELREGGRLEWTVRYSFNSVAMDQRRIFVFSEVDLGAP